MHKFQIFEPNLTPENADDHGYEYINDVLYDINHINKNFQKTLYFIIQNECKLGTPAKQVKFFFGLYILKEKLNDDLINEMKKQSFIDLKAFNRRKLDKIKRELSQLIWE